jgi:ATP-dependent Clp protease adapter protein ClpS
MLPESVTTRPSAALLWRVAFLVAFAVLNVWGHWAQWVAILMAALSLSSAFLLFRRSRFSRFPLYALTMYFVGATVIDGINLYFHNPAFRQQPISAQIFSWLIPGVIAALLVNCCIYSRYPALDGLLGGMSSATTNRASALIARVAGAVLLAFGTGLSILAIWVVERQFTLRGSLQLTAIAMVMGFSLLAAFCFPVGYRLLLNRPNRYGSLLSPAGWVVLGICILSITLLLIVYGSQADRPLWAAAVGLVLLACGCFLAARNSSRAAKQTSAFPPETALLRLDGFTPPGFVFGVEILNDNLTPMTFVISVLQSGIGLGETDAIRTMLAIHEKGGVLLPMQSFDEAKRVADFVMCEARSKDHPLVCRAVKVE